MDRFVRTPRCFRKPLLTGAVFISASKDHVDWLQGNIQRFIKIKGHITKSINSSVYQLKYAKADSLKLLPKMYYNAGVVCLSRKRQKIEEALRAVNLTI